ncbi:transposase [Vibrio breoganii]
MLDKLKAFLDKTINRVPSEGLTGKAVSYMLNQWSKLVAYCDSGELRISNIMEENAIRPFAVGRRAWLFADTPSGAQASATCYS